MSDSTAVLRARIDLPTTTGSVPIARHLVTQLLAAWSAKARHEESMLLLSELVTNVVRHVRPTTTFTIELILSQLRLRVSVLDSSPTPPVVRDRSPAGGHGLWLVTAMADRWGSARHGTGKTGVVRAQPMTPPAAAVRYPGPGPDNITSGSALDALLLLHPWPTSAAAELKALRQGDHALSEALHRPPLPHSVGRHGRRRPGLTSRSHLPEASR